MAQMTEYELQKAYLQERKKALRSSIKLETVKVKAEVTQVGKLAGMGLSGLGALWGVARLAFRKKKVKTEKALKKTQKRNDKDAKKLAQNGLVQFAKAQAIEVLSKVGKDLAFRVADRLADRFVKKGGE